MKTHPSFLHGFFLLMAFISLFVGIAFFTTLCTVRILKNMLGLQGLDQEILGQQGVGFHSHIQLLCIQ